MSKSDLCLPALALLPLSFLLSGCGMQRGGSQPVVLPLHTQGMVHGGQQPVSGASVQLYAVGTSAYGAASRPLLTPATTSDANGGFNITGIYTCPSSSALVYIVASGGNPGLAAGSNNAALALMAALGPCGGLSASTHIIINEVTTVAAVYALAPYMTSATAIGSGASDAAGLASAFTLAAELVNPNTGSAPGTGVPAGTAVPVEQINTIGNIVASCVNSAGGVSGDGSFCGTLFSLTTPNGSTPATDTITALLHLANNPALNTTALYNLATPIAPFQPSLAQVPPDLAVRLTVPSGFTVSPAVVNFPATRVGSTAAAQTITFTNNTTMPIGINIPVIAGMNPPLSGADPGDFPIAGNTFYSCPVPVLQGATCTIQFAFKPAATGTRSAYLTATNTSGNPVLSILLTGEGLEAGAGPATLSSSSLNFQAAGTPQSVTLTNAGTMPLTIDGISIGNDPTSGQPAFTQTNTCGPVLAVQASCTIAVSALATTQPYPTGVLTVADDAAGSPQTVQLSYSNGFSGRLLLDFGSRSVGTQGVGSPTGLPGYPASPETVTLTGANAADFSFQPDSSSQTTMCYPARNHPTCDVQIFFTPSAQGLRTTTLNVDGRAIGGVVGTGLSAGAHFRADSSVDFQFVHVGQTASLTVQVLNNGTVPLTLDAPVLSGLNAGDFSVITTCTAVLAPNATCSLNVTAAPTLANNRLATLTLTDSTGAAQQTVLLRVFGVNPPPIVTPNMINFGYIPVGSVSAPQTFTVTSYNNDPVSVAVGNPQLAPFLLTQGNSCSRTPARWLWCTHPHLRPRGTTTVILPSAISTSPISFPAR